MEENRKEILTREKIKNELLKIYKYNISLRMLLTLVFSLLPLLILVCVKFPIYDINDGISTVAISVSYILLSLLLIYLVWSSIKFLCLISKINSNQFEILLDKLVNKQESKYYKHQCAHYGYEQVNYVPNYRKPRVSIFAFENWQFFVLSFQKFQKFLIPVGKLYRWSDKFRMEDWAVYRWADIGDEFYVVTAKNKPLYVYNTKHFELKD